jgi:hypothetical protein
MPTILFNPRSHKDSNDDRIIDTNVWNIARFESLSGRIHRPLSKDSGYQKAMMDVSTTPKEHTIFRNKRIQSVHRPLKKGCAAMPKDPDFDDVNKYPHHQSLYRNSGTIPIPK